MRSLEGGSGRRKAVLRVAAIFICSGGSVGGSAVAEVFFCLCVEEMEHTGENAVPPLQRKGIRVAVELPHRHCLGVDSL